MAGANAALTGPQGALTAAQQQAADATAQRDAANAALAGAKAPFGVAYGGVVIPTQEYTFNGGPTTCTGYVSTYHCDGYNSFTGFIRQGDGSIVFELPGRALIPLTTDDGLTWYGNAEASQTGVSCQDDTSTSRVDLTMRPLTFLADPSTASVIANELRDELLDRHAGGSLHGRERELRRHPHVLRLQLRRRAAWNGSLGPPPTPRSDVPYVDGVGQQLGGPRPRAVLALLALNSGRALTVDRLIDDLWDDHVVLASPRNNIQVYVSSLRRLLRPCARVDVDRR